MPDLWTDLLGCLDLRSTGRQSDNIVEFEGVSQQLNYHRVFGGQLLGQFIRIAELVGYQATRGSAAPLSPTQSVGGRLSGENVRISHTNRAQEN